MWKGKAQQAVGLRSAEQGLWNGGIEVSHASYRFAMIWRNVS